MKKKITIGLYESGRKREINFIVNIDELKLRDFVNEEYFIKK